MSILLKIIFVKIQTEKQVLLNKFKNTEWRNYTTLKYKRASERMLDQLQKSKFFSSTLNLWVFNWDLQMITWTGREIIVMKEQIFWYQDFSFFINQTDKNNVLFDEFSSFIYFRGCGWSIGIEIEIKVILFNISKWWSCLYINTPWIGDSRTKQSPTGTATAPGRTSPKSRSSTHTPLPRQCQAQHTDHRKEAAECTKCVCKQVLCIT